MPEEPLTERADIPSTYSRLIARELELTAKELPRLLRGTGLRREQFLQEDLRLTPTQQLRILRNAMQLSEHPDFGLRLGKRLTPSTHGALGFVANSSPDLLTAMQAVQLFLPTRISFARFTLQQSDDWLDCAFSFDIEMDADIGRCLSETLAKACFEIAEFIVGRAPEEAEIGFSHSAPEYHRLYSRQLPGRILFDCERFMFRLPISLCHEPNASASHENYLLAMQQCENMLATLPDTTRSYAVRIRKMMLSGPPATLSEDEAAAALFISKRTLARKLAAEQTGFREIRDDILSQQAADYLCRNRLSVEAVAALLNYHDSANFRRAFKRWFDMPPEQYRKAVKAQTPPAP